MSPFSIPSYRRNIFGPWSHEPTKYIKYLRKFYYTGYCPVNTFSTDLQFYSRSISIRPVLPTVGPLSGIMPLSFSNRATSSIIL